MTSTPPPIVFYAPSFDSLGGGEIWLNRIANGLAERGRHVHVIGKRFPETRVAHSWHPSVSRDYLIDEGAARPGAPTRVRHMERVRALAGSGGPVSTAVRRVGDVLLRGWRPAGAFVDDIPPEAHRRLAAVVERIRLEEGGVAPIVVCTDVYTGSHLARASAHGDIQSSFWVMHQSTFASLTSGTLRAYRAAAEHAAHFVALTEEDAEGFRGAGFPRVVVAHNPRPTAPSPALSSERPKVVAWMARMIPLKAGPVALRAWARVAPEFPDWQLHLYGDGPERSRLERLAARLGVTSSVKFKGVVDDPVGAFAHARINLLTSRFEGWALVIGEAAAQRVPTVAADTSPGIRLQIEDGTSGLLVQAGDVRGTGDALMRLMADDDLLVRMGASAEQQSTRFALDHIVDHWDGLLRVRPL